MPNPRRTIGSSLAASHAPHVFTETLMSLSALAGPPSTVHDLLGHRRRRAHDRMAQSRDVAPAALNMFGLVCSHGQGLNISTAPPSPVATLLVEELLAYALLLHEIASCLNVNWTRSGPSTEIHQSMLMWPPFAATTAPTAARKVATTCAQRTAHSEPTVVRELVFHTRFSMCASRFGRRALAVDSRASSASTV